MIAIRSAAESHTGYVRTNNEDLAVISGDLAAIADGMGGHLGGEVAARTAIEELVEAFQRDRTASGLVSAVRKANRAIWRKSRVDRKLHGMGTTLTAAALLSNGADRSADGAPAHLALVNVGDSRAYRVDRSDPEHPAVSRLTEDHSVVEEMVRQGELTRAEAAVHPHRHVLTRALGIDAEVDVDIWDLEPVPGNRYLLCSDGLSDEVPEDEIARVMASSDDPHEVARELVGVALARGGIDNVTVVVIDVVETDAAEAPQPLEMVPPRPPMPDQGDNHLNSDMTQALPITRPEGGGDAAAGGLAAAAGGLAAADLAAGAAGGAAGSAAGTAGSLAGQGEETVPLSVPPGPAASGDPAGDWAPGTQGGSSGAAGTGGDAPGEATTQALAASTPELYDAEHDEGGPTALATSGPGAVAAAEEPPASSSAATDDTIAGTATGRETGVAGGVAAAAGGAAGVAGGAAGGDTSSTPAVGNGPLHRRSGRSMTVRASAPQGAARTVGEHAGGHSRATVLVPTKGLSKQYRDRVVTFRVFIFLVLLAALLGGAVAVVIWFQRSSYYVGLDGSHISIYAGRPGGLLWFKPQLVETSQLTTKDLLPNSVVEVKHGISESSYGAAKQEVTALTRLSTALGMNPNAPTTTTTTTTFAPSTTVPTSTQPNGGSPTTVTPPTVPPTTAPPNTAPPTTAAPPPTT